MSAGGSLWKTTVLAVAATVVVIALGVSVALWWRAPEPATVEPVEPPAPYPAPRPGDGPEPGARQQGGPDPLWSVVDEGSVQVAPPYPESWSEAGRVLVDVTVAASRADSWRVGDRLAVELPQLGGVHEWTVERIAVGQDARSRSVRGWIDSADDRPRRIVVTVGPGRVLAYIDTLRGPYELTGNARLAWLLPSSSMMAGIDFSKPDYILPERQRGDAELP